MLKKVLLLSCLWIICSFASQAQSYENSWPDDEPIITSAIMSRTSITVRSIEESLVLYRDILGMTPFYERTELSDPRLPAFSNMGKDQTMNLTVLRTETNGAAKLNLGYIGLSEIREADGSLAKLPDLPKDQAMIGSVGLILVVEDTKTIHDKVVAAGFEVISAPTEKEDGSHTQLLMRGPSGERLWISESIRRAPFLERK